MLGGQPLEWDDPVWLTDPLLQQSAGDAVQAAFTTLRDRAYYPLLRLSWWLQGAVAPQPSAAHAVSLLGFLARIPLLGTVLLRLGASRFAVFGALALWAVHPTRVESVAWLTSRKDVASLLGVAVAAHLVLSERHRTAVGAFLAACLFKAAVFPVAGVFVVVQWVRGRRRPLELGVGLVAVGLVIALGGWAAFHGSEAGWGSARAGWPFSGGAENLAFCVGLQAHWLASVVWPVGLAAIYPLPASPWMGGAASVLVLVGAAGLAHRAGPWGWALWALWLLPLLPVHGLVAMPFWGADRHLLLPSLAVALAGCLGLERLVGHGLGRAAPVGVLVVLLAGVTVQRIPDWHDTLALWEADARRGGRHWVRGLNHGTALGVVGRFDEAVEAFQAVEAETPSAASRGRVLARRLIAELAADGWTRQDAAVAQMLEPPPPDGAGWRAVAEALQGAQRCAAVAQAVRLGAEGTEALAEGCP